MNTGYCITAQLRILLPEKTTQILAALEALTIATRREAGCLFFEYHHNGDDNNETVILWEGFKDKAAFDAHFTEQHTKDYLNLGYTEVCNHWISYDTPQFSNTTETRYQRGLRKLAEVDGQQGQQVIEALQDIAPDLATYIIEFAFGDIYCREGLDLRQRELVTLATLITLGDCEPQLAVHIHGALNVGLSRQQIVETMLHCIPYCGFPRVLNAIQVLKAQTDLAQN